MTNFGGKVFNDPIHGHFELSALSVKVIDTPQFQRLRDISQLGGVYYVFAGAASRRFEHCLGVAHLARQFVEAIRMKQPDLGITDVDCLCLELAGLCHDIGHGPFSHLYDGRFLPAILHNHDFSHEHASIGILDLLIEENGLYPIFQAHGLNHDDIHFVKELILGHRSEAPPGFVWKGRGHKTFLYDIVANKRNGIDVDKFDYFARDCHVLGVTKSFDALRLMRFAMAFRVSRESYRGALLNDDIDNAESVNGGPSQKRKMSIGSANGKAGNGIIPLEICFHVKEAWNIFELFHTRYALHKRAYQHRVAAAIELMLLEAMLLADPFLKFSGQDGKLYPMSRCPEDMSAYWKLSDSVIKMIECSYSDELAPARAVIERVRRRDLFAFAGEIILSAERKVELKLTGSHATGIVKDQLLAIQSERRLQNTSCASPEVSAKDIFCELVKIGYGKGNKNPVHGLTAFYEPKKSAQTNTNVTPPISAETVDASSTPRAEQGEDEVSPTPLERQTSDLELQSGRWNVGVVPQDAVSRVTPREFEEVYIRVYCRFKHQSELVRDLFSQWCQNIRVQQPITPMKRSISVEE